MVLTKEQFVSMAVRDLKLKKAGQQGADDFSYENSYRVAKRKRLMMQR